MNKIIIHAAFPRTATTWFQDNFYPRVTNYTFVKNNEFRNFIQNKETPFNFNDINLNDDLIFCDEEIMNIKINTLSIEEKAKKLKQNFPNAQIIIFIRNQLSILESEYSFYVQSGGTMSLNEMIEHLFTINRFIKWDYFKQIKLYTKLFGKNNVRIFLYEDFKTNNFEFLKDYIFKYNFNVNLNTINFNKRNYSLNVNILKILRFLNEFTKTKIGMTHDNEKIIINIPYFFIFTRKIFYPINKVLPKKHIKLKKSITDSNYRKTINYFSKTNKNLISEFNLINIKKYNYPL